MLCDKVLPCAVLLCEICVLLKYAVICCALLDWSTIQNLLCAALLKYYAVLTLVLDIPVQCPALVLPCSVVL